jgi:DNA-binding SARP family transcriptional activator
MSHVCVCLLGKFSIIQSGKTLESLDAYKVQELFCYLLLHRDRPHSREMLAGLLWGDSSTAQSKKYLRQTLWHLQTALDQSCEQHGERLLLVDADWVQLNPKADVWLDVALFEEIFAQGRAVIGPELTPQSAQSMQQAVALYKGDLLEGWYQDWCLYKREQLQNAYLSMLTKLMSYCEAQQDYETGLSYGACILSYDRASERTHRRLMRLQYLAGDRTAALRQYERCVAALDEELGVKPAKSTMLLHERIRLDQLESLLPPSFLETALPHEPTSALLPEVLNRLKLLQAALTDIQGQVQQSIKSAELALKGRR